MTKEHLNSPDRYEELQQILLKKKALRLFYHEVYNKYSKCLQSCPKDGIAIEIGAGAGFAKEIIPDLVTTDLVSYPGIDRVIDAKKMPFENSSLRAIFLFNAFHHINDVTLFLSEAERCLLPGGRIFMVDQNRGWISTPILKYFHHEDFDSKAEWTFKSSGPLSSANGALAWIVFKRDREVFEKKFPQLKIVKVEPHSPLRYWLSGGLKSWSLLSTQTFKLVGHVENKLLQLSDRFGSFLDIEIVK